MRHRYGAVINTALYRTKHRTKNFSEFVCDAPFRSYEGYHVTRITAPPNTIRCFGALVSLKMQSVKQLLMKMAKNWCLHPLVDGASIEG